MAGNKEIGQLPAADALTGDEIFELVQLGNSRKATTQQFADLTTNQVDMMMFLPSVPENTDGVLVRLYFARAVTFAVDLGTASIAKAIVASTGTATFTLSKNGSPIGTVVFTASASGVITVAGGVSFAAGDYLDVIAPVSPDATLASISFTFSGSKLA